MFDVGHGAGSFSWQIVETALSQDVLPTTISSDLHIYNVNGPVYDLASVVTKFLHLGLSIEDSISRVTSVPSSIIGMEGEVGTLSPGAFGDAVVFELREGDFRLEDSRGEVRTGKRNLVPVTVVKGGRVYTSRGRTGS